MMAMPGKSFTGDPPPLTTQQTTLRDLLRHETHSLAAFGPRDIESHYDALRETALYITNRFADAGLSVHLLQFGIDDKVTGNLEVRIEGAAEPDQCVVIGAHYDTIPQSPGANDNASGVAAVIALAHRFADTQPKRSLRFVAFVNEEPPYFQTPLMGSWVYARDLKEAGVDVTAMISFDGIGCFRREKGSQQHLFPMNLKYPSEGNFIAFVTNLNSRPLLARALGTFREHATIASEGLAAPSHLPGVGWSDHWSFWQHDYPAILVTDTLPYRYDHYHAPTDTADQLDYDSMARVVDGMAHVIADLADVPQ